MDTINKLSAKCHYCGEMFIENLKECREHVKICEHKYDKNNYCGYDNNRCSGLTRTAVLTNTHSLFYLCDACLKKNMGPKQSHMLVCF